MKQPNPEKSEASYRKNEKNLAVVQIEKRLRVVLKKLDGDLSKRNKGYLKRVSIHIKEITQSLDMVKKYDNNYQTGLEKKLVKIVFSIINSSRRDIDVELKARKRGYKNRVKKTIKLTNTIIDLVHGNNSLYFPHLKLTKDNKLVDFVPKIDNDKPKKGVQPLIMPRVIKVDDEDGFRDLVDDYFDSEDDMDQTEYVDYFPELNMDYEGIQDTLYQEETLSDSTDFEVLVSADIPRGCIYIHLTMDEFGVEKELLVLNEIGNYEFLIEIILSYVEFNFEFTIGFNETDYNRGLIAPKKGSDPTLN